MPLHVSSTVVLLIRSSKLYYAASDIITPVGGCPVHRLREDQPVHRTATYRCDDTRGCRVQFCPPDDEHMCSKHVEAWNKLIIKFSASSWLILIYKHKFLFYNKFIIRLYMFRALLCSSSRGQNCIIQPLVSSFVSCVSQPVMIPDAV